MKLVALVLSISFAFAWFAMQKPELIERQGHKTVNEVLSPQTSFDYQASAQPADSAPIVSCNITANDMVQWGMPYDFEYGQSLDSDWQQKQGLELPELLNLAEHGDSIAMLRVAQLAFHHALPQQGFLQDKVYQEETFPSEKTNTNQWKAYDHEQVFSLATYWAEQAALHGKAYGFNLLGRAYLARLIHSPKPKAQWLVKYFTYTQLWQEQAGQALENHSMLEVLQDSEQQLQSQITLAKQDFHQQRLQLGLISPNQC